MEEEEGGERKAWRREAMEEGEADEEKGEMKKVSVLMHSCLLCTDSCTQGHTHKQTDADARVRARAPPPPPSITLASLAPSAGCICPWSFPNCGPFQGPALPALCTFGF